MHVLWRWCEWWSHYDITLLWQRSRLNTAGSFHLQDFLRYFLRIPTQSLDPGGYRPGSFAYEKKVTCCRSVVPAIKDAAGECWGMRASQMLTEPLVPQLLFGSTDHMTRLYQTWQNKDHLKILIRTAYIWSSVFTWQRVMDYTAI